MSTTGLVDTKQQPGETKRRQYSEALKRQLVAETQALGASVGRGGRIARASSRSRLGVVRGRACTAKSARRRCGR